MNDQVEEEFRELPKDIRAKFTSIAELIEEKGLHQVGMPYVRHLQDKLWELRAKGKDGIARGIYVTASAKRVIILRFFIKKKEKTPKKEIKIALARLKEM